MINLTEFFNQAWDPITKQAKGKLKWTFMNQDNILENWVFKYFMYCSIVKEYDFVEKILSGLEVFGGVIPRCRYYGDHDMIVEDPHNTWVKAKDKDGVMCQMRVDTGTGQAPCLLGLASVSNKFVKAAQLATDFSQAIMKNGCKVKYDGKTVAQGNYLTWIPPLGNNLTELQCISHIAVENIPFWHRWRAYLSVKNYMPWDKGTQRSVCLYFLARLYPSKYKDLFDKWIAKRDKDLVEVHERMDSITDMMNPDWLGSRLDVLLQEAIRNK